MSACIKRATSPVCARSRQRG